MHSSNERKCLDGGIGRRARLKIVCPRACGFDSHSGYRERLLRKPFLFLQYSSRRVISSAVINRRLSSQLCCVIPQGHQLRCHQSQIVITTLLCHRKAYFNFVEIFIVILQYTNTKWEPRNQTYSTKNKTKPLRC